MSNFHKYISISDKDLKAMLKDLGINDIDDLFSDVPRKLLLTNELNIPTGVEENVLYDLIREICSKCKFYHPKNVFLGGGVSPIYVPSLVKYIISRSEFLTSYTPYQPEICQGTLQALFEYQSFISILTGLEVVNASMYDWASAAAEAILMALRVTGRNKVCIIGDIAPERFNVIKTYLYPHNTRIYTLKADKNTGLINLDELPDVISDTACVYMELPYFSGAIEEDIQLIVEESHKRGALFILGVDLWLLPLIKPPGEFGVDIVVGEGQLFGSPLFWGGPLLGVFAVKGDIKLIRQMPGKIVGMASTFNGERAFTMILQVREQHIRREKATSNICTNEALTAIAAAVYLSLLGGNGLIKKAIKMTNLAHKLANALREIGLNAPPYSASYFREFIVELNINPSEAISLAANKGVLIGRDVSEWYKGIYRNPIHVSINDFHDELAIENYVNILREVIDK